MSIQFHIGILPNQPVARILQVVKKAEELGFTGVWVADSQCLFRDAYAVLALAAQQTSRLQLATGVTNPLTRHPTVIAGSIATIHEISGGRALLGMGTGESAVHTIGQRPARLAELEEVTKVIRELLAGRQTSFRGRPMRMTWTRTSLPIFFASSGPKSLQMAGRLADGVLFQVGASPALVRYAIQNIREGALQAGRNPAEIRLLCRLACSLSEKGEEAREQIRGYAAAAAGTVFTSVPRQVIPSDLWEEMAELKRKYDYYQHASSEAPHKEWITERILQAIAIAGTPQEALPRFQALVEEGIDGFVLPITVPQPEDLLQLLAHSVLPRLVDRSKGTKPS